MLGIGCALLIALCCTVVMFTVHPSFAFAANHLTLLFSQPIMTMHISSLQRNKRCLLAYQNHRLGKITNLRWETAVIPPNLKGNLSDEEIAFFEDYDNLLTSYCMDAEIDLMAFSGGIVGGDGAPSRNMIEVRVSKAGGAGEIMTDDGGFVNLEEGTTHFLKRGDVERLVRQGDLEQLSSNVT